MLLATSASAKCAIASVAIASIAIGAALYHLVMYDIDEYYGDGRIEDHGPASYPRYVITFETIALAAPGDYRYTVRSPPQIDALCGLLVEPVTGRHSTPLPDSVASSVYVEMQVTGPGGRVVYKCDGPLSAWNLSRGPKRVFYWQSGYNISLRRDGIYEVVISIASDADIEGPWTIGPFLAGGGSELPF